MLVLFAVAAGTNVPTPLLLIYKDSLHLSATTLTALFGVYAAGLVPSLPAAGGLSGVASVLFIAASHSVGLLFLARFLPGVVSGAVFTVGSTWVAELSVGDSLGARRSAMAQSAGFSLGP